MKKTFLAVQGTLDSDTGNILADNEQRGVSFEFFRMFGNQIANKYRVLLSHHNKIKALVIKVVKIRLGVVSSVKHESHIAIPVIIHPLKHAGAFAHIYNAAGINLVI